MTTCRRFVFLWVVLGLLVGATSAAGQAKRSPTSKVYFSEVLGEALIDTGEKIEDLSKRAVYSAQGTVIETKKPLNDADRSKHYSTMVYSNGTGAFFDADTRVEIRRFIQEPFTPNRTDLEAEPSISQTQAFVSRGTVGLCTSKLVAGSSMTYQTPHGLVNIRGRKIVIESANDITKISMLEGECTVRAGANDLGGRTLRAGEQAIIRRGEPGQPNRIEIAAIPAPEMPELEERVALACLARRTVYFDVGGDTAGGEGVNAFDGSAGQAPEIVPVETVPVNLPVQFTVSPAAIITPARTVNPGQGPGP